MRLWVRAAQGDGAPAFRAKLAGGDGHAGEAVQVRPWLVGAEGQHVELHVRAGAAGQHARKHVGDAGRPGEGAAARQQVLQPHLRQAEHAVLAAVQAQRLVEAIDHPGLQVVLQVAAHLGAVGHHGNAVLRQVLGRADARQQQQVRRVDGAAAEDDLAHRLHAMGGAVALHGHARGAAGGGGHAGGQRAGDDREVGARHRRLQIGAGGGPAQPVARGGLRAADAFLGRAVEVVVAGNTGLHRRLDEGFYQGVVVAEVADGERAALAAQFGARALIVLAQLEVGQHVLEVPAGAALLAPLLEILALAADVDQAVQGGRAAQHPAARPDQPAVVQVGLRLGQVVPAQRRVVHGLGVADRQVNPGVGVAVAGFQQQHAHAGVLAEPGGDDATGAAGADDDVVGLLGQDVGHACFPLRVADAG